MKQKLKLFSAPFTMRVLFYYPELYFEKNYGIKLYEIKWNKKWDQDDKRLQYIQLFRFLCEDIKEVISYFKRRSKTIQNNVSKNMECFNKLIDSYNKLLTKHNLYNEWNIYLEVKSKVDYLDILLKTYQEIKTLTTAFIHTERTYILTIND